MKVTLLGTGAALIDPDRRHTSLTIQIGDAAYMIDAGTGATRAMIGAAMVAKGIWREPGVWNMEQLDPDPFLEDVAARGLPWHVEER